LGPQSNFQPAFLLISLLVLTLFFFAQRFFVRRAITVIRRSENPKLRRTAYGVLYSLLVFIVIVIANRLFLHVLPRGGVFSFFVAIVQLWLFASFFAFLGIKLIHLFDSALRKIRQVLHASKPQPEITVDPGRRSFFRAAATFVGAVPLVAAVYGFAKERFDFRFRQVDIPVANLPQGLDGLRIVHLSDIHIGDFMPAEQIRRAVDMANSTSAHLAVVTGDFVTSVGDPLEQCITELSRLRAPLGVWGCNGNHEIYAEVEDLTEGMFAKYGMRLLRQNSAELTWQNEKFNLIGVDYQRDHSPLGLQAPMLQAIEPLVRQDIPNILLSHNPNSFYRAAELGIELSLAGHTHGGQIKVEIVDHSWSPARFMTRFVAGLYHLPLAPPKTGKSSVYVNRGLGTIGIPARLGVDPEVSILTLRRA